MSMGSLILAGGTPGKRQALPNSRILIHQPTGGFQGQTTDIEIHARESPFPRRRMEEIYAEHTGRSLEELRRDMERDRFFTPEEAVDYGLIDRVHADRNGNGYPAAFVPVLHIERLTVRGRRRPTASRRGSRSDRRRGRSA